VEHPPISGQRAGPKSVFAAVAVASIGLGVIICLFIENQLVNLSRSAAAMDAHHMAGRIERHLAESLSPAYACTAPGFLDTSLLFMRPS